MFVRLSTVLKMQTLLVPVLVLATAALSSSNVLPIVTMSELNTQPLDFKTRNKLNAILFNVDVDPEIDNTQANYAVNNEDLNIISNSDNYNVKGFRKEQWHNYPRQLDRLNKYFYQRQSADKRDLDPDDPILDESVDKDQGNLDDITDEYDPRYGSSLHTDDEAEMAAAVINPLLIYRIHLACYNKNKAVNQATLESVGIDNDRLEGSNKDGSSFSDEVDPGLNLIKVKREDKINSGSAHESTEHRTVNKRLFALFSRLQTFSPKAHQMHHRRHMYALYGPPDGAGGAGGPLTAETRATFMRPPGSPLRWG